MKQIGQDTLVPLGLAIVVIGSVSMWVADVRSEIKLHDGLIQELKQASETNYKVIYEINSRLSRIEWRLETKK